MSKSEPEAATVTPLPFELPAMFVEQLGYRRDRRFVAVYWEPLGDEVTFRDDTFLLCGGNWYPFTQFFHRCSGSFPRPRRRRAFAREERSRIGADGPSSQHRAAHARSGDTAIGTRHAGRPVGCLIRHSRLVGTTLPDAGRTPSPFRRQSTD
jgi:hypothetical protein